MKKKKLLKIKQTEIKLKKKSSKNMIPSKNTKNMNEKSTDCNLYSQIFIFKQKKMEILKLVETNIFN